MNTTKLLMAKGATNPTAGGDSSAVFSAYLRTGTGADIVTTTGIDMTQGYMLWSKGRSGATDHAIYDSARGVTKDLVSNSTAAETTQTTGLKSVSTTGHTIGSLAKMNTSGATYVDWVFREAPKFFKKTTKLHTNGTASTVDLTSLGTVGMVTVKSTIGPSNWFTWHRSLTTSNNLKLNLTDAESTTNAYLSVSGTTLTIASTAPSDTYVVYAWAHDTSTDGVIQCGSFTTDGSGNATVNLGWEPQYLTFKCSNASENWITLDSMRGFTMGSDAYLNPNTSGAEGTTALANPTATGFIATWTPNQTYIYMAIRRPNKVPTSGTEIYNAITWTGNSAARQISGVGFSPDAAFIRDRSATTGYSFVVQDRLRGAGNELQTWNTGAEFTGLNNCLTSFTMDGVALGDDASNHGYNVSPNPEIGEFFKRAKGFFDIVCYTGTGVSRTVNHNLGVVPELIIVKGRINTNNWAVSDPKNGWTNYLSLNTTNATSAYVGLWNDTTPTNTVFSLGDSGGVNQSANTYVAYLFATLAGVSKVGSYTGNGTSQTINCGFSTGARFILIKRTDSTGDWYIWDTTRGIVAGNDPHLSLNTTAAEVTTDDSIDPDASGFIVNQVAATNINVTSASYIYLAIA